MEKVFNIYKVETGFLLKKNDSEYDDYAHVYDKEHSYCDNNVVFFLNKEDALNYAEHRLDENSLRIYAIVSELSFDGSQLSDDEMQDIISEIEGDGYMEDYDAFFADDELYGVDNVIFAQYKKSSKSVVDIF